MSMLIWCLIFAAVGGFIGYSIGDWRGERTWLRPADHRHPLLTGEQCSMSIEQSAWVVGWEE